MVTVLCLFIYSMTEFWLRRRLQESGQTKKQTQRPTLKWTFFLFRGVRELKFASNGSISTIVTNMTPELWTILQVLGWGARNIIFDGIPAENRMDDNPFDFELRKVLSVNISAIMTQMMF